MTLAELNAAWQAKRSCYKFYTGPWAEYMRTHTLRGVYHTLRRKDRGFDAQWLRGNHPVLHRGAWVPMHTLRRLHGLKVQILENHCCDGIIKINLWIP